MERSEEIRHVVSRWLKDNRRYPTEMADIYIGISTDEIHRVNNRPNKGYERKVYPLIDLSLDRAACQQVIASATSAHDLIFNIVNIAGNVLLQCPAFAETA